MAAKTAIKPNEARVRKAISIHIKYMDKKT